MGRRPAGAGALRGTVERRGEVRRSEGPDAVPGRLPRWLSFSWGAPVTPATIQSASNLRSLAASGSGIARDNVGGAHEVSFDVTWTDPFIRVDIER